MCIKIDMGVRIFPTLYKYSDTKVPVTTIRARVRRVRTFQIFPVILLTVECILYVKPLETLLKLAKPITCFIMDILDIIKNILTGTDLGQKSQ
jgi:hypothetical protein